MRNGSFSRYYNVSSIIHSLNPLCKILALLIFIFMVMLGSNLRVMCALFLVVFFLIGVSNVPFLNYIKPLYGMKVLFIFVFIINLLFGVSVYSSFIMVSRICLVLLYSSVLIYTTTTNDMAFGFSSLLRPLGVWGFPVSKVSMAIALALNFIPSLFLISNKIVKAQASRGFNYRSGSFKDRIVGIKSVFIPMFVLAFRRADSVSDAMEIKNFSFSSERSSVSDFRWRFGDVYMIMCHLVFLVFVLIKEVVL